jgi:hypothetical protein
MFSNFLILPYILLEKYLSDKVKKYPLTRHFCEWSEAKLYLILVFLYKVQLKCLIIIMFIIYVVVANYF